MERMSRSSAAPSGDDTRSSPGDAVGPVALAKLLQQSAGGDESAFAELYDLTSARVFGLVRRVVRDPAQSEEVAQEVFIDIWRHCTRFANIDVSHDSTSESVVQRLDAERVHEALGTLTEAQRGALELAYLGGYTHTEVATMLGVPLGTAKTRIRDGLIRLRDTLGVTT